MLKSRRCLLPGLWLTMHFTTAVLVAAFAARDVLATPIARSPYVVKETHFVPKKWSKQERSHGGKTIQLQIGLKQGRFDELDSHLNEGKIMLAVRRS
jgi:tripeptidyl-peptidase-1